MPNEASKARPRIQRYLLGAILDVGAGGDVIAPGARSWDLSDGDAQLLDSIPDESFDTVFSSHCLEHMRNPLEAILNWWRVLKPGGHLVVLIPDEDLYEQHLWPSFGNSDHKWSFTPHKDASWAPMTCNVLDLVKHLYRHKLVSLTIQDTGYQATTEYSDQTQTAAEAAVELVVRKQSEPDGIRHSIYDQNIWCHACGSQMYLLGRIAQELHVQCVKCGAIGTVPINA